MRHIEVLIFKGKRGRLPHTFLHDPETGRVYSEDVGDFIYRCLKPHEENYEIRTLELNDPRVIDHFALLKSLQLYQTEGVDHQMYAEAFLELWLIANGYYAEREICKFWE